MTTLGAHVLRISGWAQRNEPLLRSCTLLLIALLVVGFSVWQGAYNFDPHHWGLMLSNARDLSEGKLPYRDIFVQYGLLTTLIHSLAFRFLGHNLQSLIVITAIAYAAGLIGIYQLAFRLTRSRKLAIYTFVTCALLHWVAIYPWPNYVAFPFLVYGTLLFMGSDGRSARALTGGLLLAAAVLCREGLFFPVVLFSLIATLVKRVTQEKDETNATRSLWLFWAGLAAPLVGFFAWLGLHDLRAYWYKNSVVLPQMYADYFFRDGAIAAASKFAGYFLGGLVSANSRIGFLALVVLAAVWMCVSVTLRRERDRQHRDLALVALFTLLLLSTALHLQEIFRLATSITLGAALVYYLASLYRAENVLFLVVAGLLASSLAEPGNGNSFLPTARQMAAATTSSTPDVFRGQRWPAYVFDYYAAIESDLRALQVAPCAIKYHHNDTADAFLAALSPFMQYQLAPFGRSFYDVPGLFSLRPEYDVERKLKTDRDMVMFVAVPNEAVASYQPPAGHVVFSSYPTGRLPQDLHLLIVAPGTCVRSGAPDPGK